MMSHEIQGQEKRSILIVEDDEDIRESLATVLDSEGFPTVTAPNGREALDVLLSRDALPSLIFLDIMMPVMDGKEFLAVKERDARLSSIPVVVLTAGMHKGASSSVVRLMKKPVELDALLEIAGRYAGMATSS